MRMWGKGGVACPPLGVGGHERCPADWATRCLSCRYQENRQHKRKSSND